VSAREKARSDNITGWVHLGCWTAIGLIVWLSSGEPPSALIFVVGLILAHGHWTAARIYRDLADLEDAYWATYRPLTPAERQARRAFSRASQGSPFRDPIDSLTAVLRNRDQA
jgi:hypothetical protein